MKRLVIIFPAYNEEGRIKPTLEAYVDFFSKEQNTFVVEYMVALNGCTDNTRTVVENCINANPKADITLHEWKAKIGKGGALHKAFAIAKGDYIGFVDADNSTVPEEFFILCKQVADHDGVIASRWKAGSHIIDRNSIWRQFASWLFTVAVRLIFWMPFVDTQCGAKVFKKEALHTVLPYLRVSDMAFDVELLYVLYRKGFDVIETPSRWVAHDNNSASFSKPLKVLSQGLHMIRSLFAIRFRKFI